MTHRTHGPDARRIQLNRRRIAPILIAAALLATSCGSDDSDDAPATTVGPTPTAAPSGEGGVPLEPGSNLPPSDSDMSPAGTTVGSDVLAPADSLVGGGG